MPSPERSSNLPDMPVILDSTLQREAAEMTEVIDSRVRGLVAEGRATIQRGDIDQVRPVFEAHMTDQDTGKSWEFRRKPHREGYSWTVSTPTSERERETVMVTSRPSSYSEITPDVKFYRAEGFNIKEKRKNTQGALQTGAKVTSEIPLPANSTAQRRG